MSLKDIAFKFIILRSSYISDDVPDNILAYLLLLQINPLSVMSPCLIFELSYQALLQQPSKTLQISKIHIRANGRLNVSWCRKEVLIRFKQLSSLKFSFLNHVLLSTSSYVLLSWVDTAVGTVLTTPVNCPVTWNRYIFKNIFTC